MDEVTTAGGCDMPPSDFSAVEIAKILVPMLGGGLAGSLLTAFLASSKRKREEKRVMASVEAIPIKVHTGILADPELKVSYKGSQYEQLYQLHIALLNPGLQLISPTNIKLVAPKGSVILSTKFMSKPRGQFERETQSTFTPRAGATSESAMEFHIRLPDIASEDWVRAVLIIYVPEGAAPLEPDGRMFSHFWDDDSQGVLYRAFHTSTVKRLRSGEFVLVPSDDGVQRALVSNPYLALVTRLLFGWNWVEARFSRDVYRWSCEANRDKRTNP